MDISVQTLGVVEIIIGMVGLIGIVTLIILGRIQRRQPLPQHHLLKRVSDTLRGILGWFLILTGVVVTPLPIPLGIPMIIMGVAVIGRRSRRLRLLFYTARRRLRELVRNNPPVVGSAAMWLLVTERKLMQSYRHRTWKRLRAYEQAQQQAPTELATPLMAEQQLDHKQVGGVDADNDLRHPETQAQQ